MEDASRPLGSRAVSIGGDARGNVIQTGDGNVASVRYQHVSLPPPASVDMRAEVMALRELLTGLGSEHGKKIAHALDEADEEINKPEADREEVGKALSRALDYAQKAEGFAGIVETLRPHVARVASWLGSNWHRLVGVVGLTL